MVPQEIITYSVGVTVLSCVSTISTRCTYHITTHTGQDMTILGSAYTVNRADKRYIDAADTAIMLTEQDTLECILASTDTTVMLNTAVIAAFA